MCLYRERFSEKGIFENSVYPGVPEALSELQRNGCEEYVVTSKPTVFARWIIEHFGLGRFFKVVHGSHLDGILSNKAELIKHVLSNDSIDARHAVMVGDRKHDMIGAKANGVVSIGVSWGYGSKQELLEAVAKQICDDPASLLELISGHRTSRSS